MEEMDELLAAQNAKLAADYGIAPEGACAQNIHFASQNCCESTQSRAPTLLEEAERNAGFHRQQAEKADQAAAFLRANPAFDEFVRLIRQGVLAF